LRQFVRAEELYRRATEKDPAYVLAFFDLGNVLDELERPEESIAAYERAVALAPRYADAHYNLALAYERRGERRAALRHWEAYVKLDRSGPWADHARSQIRKLLDTEKLTILWRAERFVAPARGMAALQLVNPPNSI
jgi:tetratricopeptide (TPR) repeat protein